VDAGRRPVRPGLELQRRHPERVAGEALTLNQCVYLSDGSGSKTSGRWYKCDAANTYSSTLPEVGIALATSTIGQTLLVRISGSVTGLTGLSVGAKYYASGTAGAITSTAPANRRELGQADTTTSLVLAPNPSSTTWTTITTTSTGTQNDFAPGLVGNTIVRCNNATLLTITGLAAGYDGQLVKFISVGAGQVDFPHQSASSAAANRQINVATSGNTSLAAGSGIAEYAYDATTARWRLTTHEQGAWIAFTPTLQRRVSAAWAHRACQWLYRANRQGYGDWRNRRIAVRCCGRSVVQRRGDWSNQFDHDSVCEHHRVCAGRREHVRFSRAHCGINDRGGRGQRGPQ
jgi:hypothetical protein